MESFQNHLRLSRKSLLFAFIAVWLFVSICSDEDYYKLLGISREASTREIRQAFKKLALTMHPDKNPVSSFIMACQPDCVLLSCDTLRTLLLSFQNDETAHDNFLKINRAYEVLKDEDLRKKYDKYGEKGLQDEQQGGRYESWNYYRYDFGNLVFYVMFCVDVISQCYNPKVNVLEDMPYLSLHWRKTTKLCFSGIYDDDPEITTLDRGDFGK